MFQKSRNCVSEKSRHLGCTLWEGLLGQPDYLGTNKVKYLRFQCPTAGNNGFEITCFPSLWPLRGSAAAGLRTCSRYQTADPPEMQFITFSRTDHWDNQLLRSPMKWSKIYTFSFINRAHITGLWAQLFFCLQLFLTNFFPPNSQSYSKAKSVPFSLPFPCSPVFPLFSSITADSHITNVWRRVTGAC